MPWSGPCRAHGQGLGSAAYITVINVKRMTDCNVSRIMLVSAAPASVRVAARSAGTADGTSGASLRAFSSRAPRGTVYRKVFGSRLTTMAAASRVETKSISQTMQELREQKR